jgi:hypothetical protein
VAARILDIAKIEERTGIAWMLAQVFCQQRPGRLKVLLLDFAFGLFP